MARASCVILAKPCADWAFNVALSAPAMSAKDAQPEIVITVTAQRLKANFFILILSKSVSYEYSRDQGGL
ncbi:hypothetical protein ACI8B_100116 [Acinetobacter proteolyticus]|uniref:Uncharacterized protein n=1 Tax=Acinetobacter proteolyticus TaxID=1776741 RepID=A0A653JZU5_9GAMM|nr:hypothetical protein ACI8B_100116 [Acinetobacter proteolyticus]